MVKTLMILSVLLLSVNPITQANSLVDLFKSQQQTKQKFLTVHQAFQISSKQQQNHLQIDVNVVDGHYIYQDKLKLDLPESIQATALQYSIKPNFVDDPDFGRVAVFDKPFAITTQLSTQQDVDSVVAHFKWQGCAKAGLCYPPEKTQIHLQNLSTYLPSKTVTSKTVDKKPLENQSVIKPTIVGQKDKSNDNQKNDLKQDDKAKNNNLATTNNQTVNQQTDVSMDMLVETVALPTTAFQSDVQTNLDDKNLPNTLTNFDSFSFSVDDKTNDPFGLLKRPILGLFLLYMAGLGLALMPCVWPMLPIVVNIVARQHKPSAKKGLLLTLGYGLGVATSYGLLGALIAIFGLSIGVMNWLQNPVVLLSFAVLFVLLALYLLDVLPIRLPAKLSMKLQNLTQVGESRLGSITGSFITGFFSALVVSPCISAPLAGALAGVATLGSAWVGFWALFMLGLGLSTPLILLGATQGNFMPKAGEWMVWVKTGFSLLLFAVALLLVERVLFSSLMLALWAIWFAVVAMWAWQWSGRGQILSKAVAMVLAGWTLCLLMGVALGSKDSWQPFSPLLLQKNQSTQSLQPNYQKISKIQDLPTILAKYPNVLVDVTADWCIECRIMEKTLFANPPMSLQNWQVVKLDVSENNDDSKMVYQTLQTAGPPVLLYFQNGKLVARQNGQVSRDDFEKTLNQF